MSLPRPIQVELLPHDPRWAAMADEVSAALSAALGPIVVTVHHIGSTAIPGMSAKPILDLVPVVRSLPELDRHRSTIEAIGYEWWGELGLPRRRYCTKTDPHTGRRLVQLHCYEIGSSEIDRHLAFRDYLRQRPDVARAYDREKARCRSLHTDDSQAYSDCKNAWIKMVETEALVWYRS